MFEDSLLESGGKFKTKRGATTTVAVVAQFALIGVLVLLPLIYTEALPKQQLMTFLVAPPPPPPPPPPPAAAPVHVVKKIETDLNNGALRTPTAIPKKVAMIKEDEAPPSGGGVMGGVAGGVPGGSMGGNSSITISFFSRLPPPPPPKSYIFTRLSTYATIPGVVHGQ